MSKKLALSLLLIMLGFATWDAAVLDEEYTQTTEEEGQVRAMDDGCGAPVNK